jgi:NAD kinase
MHHMEGVNAFLQSAQDAGKECTVKFEYELTKEDSEGKDLIVSLGGDHTYLVASAYAPDCSLPILGINTQIMTEMGSLVSNEIDPYEAKQDSLALL